MAFSNETHPNLLKYLFYTKGIIIYTFYKEIKIFPLLLSGRRLELRKREMVRCAH